jgi:HNH endonuclease
MRKRNYRKEYDSYHGTEKQKERRADRNAARRKMEDAGRVRKGDGKDVDHRNRNTSNNSSSNLRVTSQKQNRGWRRDE